MPSRSSPKLPRKQFGYEQTLMSGYYVTEDLAKIAKEIHHERMQQQQLVTHKTRKALERARIFEESLCYRCLCGMSACMKVIINRIGEDWVFLFLLSTIMAIMSFAMDYCIVKLSEAHYAIFEESMKWHYSLPYITWIGYSVILVLFATYFVHLVAPNAIGSGIPEIKAILQGVNLKDYLTLRTFISKMVGLIIALGSNLPFGREGPFVHIASIVATLLSKWVISFRDIYENESRCNEMLAAAAATGVACTFGAPIGGVLFSIEVTATYFAVRNYWRGFFSTVCAAVLFRLLAIWFDGAGTLTVLLKTSIRLEFPFDAAELVAFGVIGIVSGAIGALYVLVHRKFVYLMRSNEKLTQFLQAYRFIYPLIITVAITSISCPLTLGKYIGGGLTFRSALTDFFSNVTWVDRQNPALSADEQSLIARWDNPSIWISLPGYMLFVFVMSAVAITLPVPSGVFIPVFTLGAALGRLVGEIMHMWYPQGINNGFEQFQIVPAGYAIVAAAALSGAVTHTISTTMIVFELTGQISYILPCVLAVLIANGVANLLQPSIYDSIIQIKKLPYLPSFFPSNSDAHKICVKDIMLSDVKYISYDTTYEQLTKLLSENSTIKAFPLVEACSNMILLGSIQRLELIRLLEDHVGKERRRTISPTGEIAAETIKETFADQAFKKRDPRKRSSLRLSRKRNLSFENHTQSTIEMDENIDKYLTVGAKVGLHKSPSKSILKKSATNPDILQTVTLAHSLSNSPLPSPDPSPREHKGVMFGDSPMGGIHIGRKSRNQSSGSDGEQSDSSADALLDPLYENTDTLSRTSLLTSANSNSLKTVRLPPVRIIDLPHDEQIRWEAEQLNTKIDFTQCQIDPAPFQLVEKTSLYKVHSIFSLLGLNHAYVTNVGHLVGVVSLKELQCDTRDLLSKKCQKRKPTIDAAANSFKRCRRDMHISHLGPSKKSQKFNQNVTALVKND